MKKKVDIGLDIGIASVGWAIVDSDSLKIIKHGARLFETVDSPKDSKLANERRREERSKRRQISRRKTLKRDFVKLLVDNKIIDIPFSKNKSEFVDAFRQKYIINNELKKQINQCNVCQKNKRCKEHSKYDSMYAFHLRKEGLKKELELVELLNVLYWYINHRGFKYEVSNDDSAKSKKEFQDYYEKKKDKFPVDLQWDFYNEYGFLNGTFNRMFHKNDYKKEIIDIFKNQKTLSNEFKDEFISLFERQRNFSHGPGNEKTPTLYGRFYEVVKDKIIARKEPLSSIWEKTIGKCSIYKDEFRAPKHSISADIFNLLNDLNNISNHITGEKLSLEVKLKCLEIAINTKASLKSIDKELANFFKLDKDDYEVNIKGFRIDKNDKRIITELKSLHNIQKAIKKVKGKDFKFSLSDILDGSNKIKEDNLIDKIVEINSINKEIEIRKTKIKNLNMNLSNEEIEEISNIDGSWLNETHSLSLKAIHKMIPTLISTNDNQMEIRIQDNSLLKEEDAHKYGMGYMSMSWIDDAIVTPTTKRAFRQTVKVLNAIFDLCYKESYEISNIVVETARENNNKSVKEADKNRQKFFESLNKQIEEQLKDYNLPSSKDKHIKTKVWYWNQQKGRDAYTNKEISLDDLINHSKDYDIDHIIPRSQSFDNSRQNLVLTSSQINSQKTNLTPYRFLKKEKFADMKEHWANWYINDKSDDRKPFKDYKKFQFLTTEIDYSKPENQIGFIQRNLVDTRYATRLVLEALNGYKNNNKLNYKVKTINGKMTSFARQKIGKNLNRPEGIELYDKDGKKNRVWNGHHAEDAYLITVLTSNYRDNKYIEKIISSKWKYDKLVSKNDNSNNEYKGISKIPYDKLIDSLETATNELNDNLSNVKFSRMVIKKKNTQLFNDTLYKGKRVENGIQQIVKKQLSQLTTKDCEKYFGSNPPKKEQLAIYKHDRNLYNALNDIYNIYSKENQPFNAAILDSKDNRLQKKEGLEIIQDGKNRFVKSISIFKNIKNINSVIVPDNNGNSFYESMEWTQLHIYRDINNRYKIIPVNATNHFYKVDPITGKSTIHIKKNILDAQLNEKSIPLDSKPIIKLNKGDALLDYDNKIWYICGADTRQESLELKLMDRIKTSKTRDYFTINSKLIGYKLIKLSILGKYKFIYKF